jgi:biopolymer transport protein ExbD
MRFRNNSSGSGKSDQQFTSMIDVVFLLLVFFMLTLKIVEPEGDFTVHMPPAPTPSPGLVVQPKVIPPIKVRLQADEDGRLVMITFGQTRLGNDEAAFDRLNNQILKVIGRPGTDFAKDLEVEIDADFQLQHEYLVKAVSACSGRRDPATGSIVCYIEKIRFTQSKRPGEKST